jgi:hypothetical protein
MAEGGSISVLVITNLRFHARNSGNHLAKDATSLIPIVFTVLVGTGVVANLARPGGNATGLMAALVEGRNVSYWHFCDMRRGRCDVRCWVWSGHANLPRLPFHNLSLCESS